MAKRRKVKNKVENLSALSFEELNKYHNRLANRANTQIKAMEQARSPYSGESLAYGSAWDKMQVLLDEQGRDKFSRGKFKGTYNDLLNETRQLQELMSWKSYGVAGLKAMEKDRINYYQEIDPTLREDIIASHGFYYFTKGEAYKLAKKILSSDQLLAKYQEVVERGKDKEFLEEVIYLYYDDITKNNKRRASWRDFEDFLDKQLEIDTISEDLTRHPDFEFDPNAPKW